MVPQLTTLPASPYRLLLAACCMEPVVRCGTQTGYEYKIVSHISYILLLFTVLEHCTHHFPVKVSIPPPEAPDQTPWALHRMPLLVPTSWPSFSLLFVGCLKRRGKRTRTVYVVCQLSLADTETYAGKPSLRSYIYCRPAGFSVTKWVIGYRHYQREPSLD